MERVLVVDDEKVFRETIALLLRKDGYRVVVAECGHTAVNAIEAFTFDVVLVDIFMPGLNGLDTIRIFRKNAPDVPIIAMSAYAYGGADAAEIFETAVELGAACCLHKPFTRAELNNAIRMCRATALVA